MGTLEGVTGVTSELDREVADGGAAADDDVPPVNELFDSGVEKGLNGGGLAWGALPGAGRLADAADGAFDDDAFDDDAFDDDAFDDAAFDDAAFDDAASGDAAPEGAFEGRGGTADFLGRCEGGGGGILRVAVGAPLAAPGKGGTWLGSADTLLPGTGGSAFDEAGPPSGICKPISVFLDSEIGPSSVGGCNSLKTSRSDPPLSVLMSLSLPYCGRPRLRS